MTANFVGLNMLNNMFLLMQLLASMGGLSLWAFFTNIALDVKFTFPEVCQAL